MFQFVHAADIHLDSPLCGLAQFEDAPASQIRMATRRAFENLIELALRERAAFVLIAGDLWDGGWPDAGPGLFFIKQAARLREADIPIFVVKGNHDAASAITKELRWPANVTIFEHARPHTVVLEHLNVAIHGQSFRDASVAEDLAAAYPPPVPGAFNIGLLHTCLDGDARHYPYAPASIESLALKGYEYWALGHVHQRRAIERDGVRIVFPGNPQGRSMNETGAKGCELVTVSENAKIQSRFEPLDVVRWFDQSIDITSARGLDDIDALVASTLEALKRGHAGRLLAVRVRLTGVTTLAGELESRDVLRDRFAAVAIDAGDVWIERIAIEARPPALDPVASSTAALPPLAEEIKHILSRLSSDDETACEWMECFAKVRAQLTGELAESDTAKALSDPAAFRALAERAAAAALTRGRAQ